MKELYVWFNTLGRKMKNIPQDADMWLSDSNSLTEFKDNPINQKWVSFNPYKDELPLKPELELPKELYLFIRTKTEPVFDWCYLHHHVMAVSSSFLNYLVKNVPQNQIEVAKLNMINVSGLAYDNKEYFAVRIIKFDDNKFDNTQSARKRAIGTGGTRFMYPDMMLIKANENRNIYFLLEFCYNDCLILTKNAKDYILSNFYSPEIYLLKDYPQAWNNNIYKDRLPDLVMPQTGSNG